MQNLHMQCLFTHACHTVVAYVCDMHGCIRCRITRSWSGLILFRLSQVSPDQPS